MLTLQKGIIRITLITLAILMVPLLAMQFNEAGEVDWSLFDFVVMGVLLFSAQLAFLMIPRRLNNLAYKTAVGISVLVVFLLILINGAVGIIGNEGNPANLMYFGVILVGVIGAILSRLKPQGMALTLCAATCVQILVGGPGCLGG